MIHTVRFSGPVLKLKLCWNGTLMRSATGFCVCFARSVALCSAASSGLARRTAPRSTPCQRSSRGLSIPVILSGRRAGPDARHVWLHARRESGSLGLARRVATEEGAVLGRLEALIERGAAPGIGRLARRRGRAALGVAGRDGGRERGTRRSVAGRPGLAT